MKVCPNCKAKVVGDWLGGPLCKEELQLKGDEEKQTESIFLNFPLKFNRQKALQLLIRASLLLVVIYFAVQIFWPFRFFGLEYVIFGLLITWTLLVIFVQKRRNIVKTILYYLLFISIMSVYFDYTNGWLGWSITFVFPVISIASLLAMFIYAQVAPLEINDYILYLQLTSLLGLVPLVFLIMDWVVLALPSLLSVLFSLFMFLLLLLKYRRLMILELQKRMHL